ncbi:MAG: nicotinate-nucleotide--dimethylbenzimidazole phosphoribosyltransferase [Myxococcota bacterium]
MSERDAAPDDLPVDPQWVLQAREHQNALTKPPGSLGRLEDVACRLAGLQRVLRPVATPARVLVAAGDHGFVHRGVSPYPSSVTGQMVANFVAGGAAVSALATAAGASLEVLVVGVADLPPLPKPSPGTTVVDARVAAGTADAVEGPAMSEPQFEIAWATGVVAVQRAVDAGVRVLALGEMGIGNTTAAAALTAALLERPAETVTGPGTGADAAMRMKKVEVVESMLRTHADARGPLDWLRRVGGFEMVALAAAAHAAVDHRVAVVADGFISTAAILAAAQARPAVRDVVFAGHRSSEPGHDALLQALEQRPLLDLELRLGEGSGAAAALGLLQAACAVHGQMATFAQAGVDGATP